MPAETWSISAATFRGKTSLLMRPTAMLVGRKDLHPAWISLLLTTAQHFPRQGRDDLTNPGDFPPAQYTDIPVSDHTRHFYKSGPPVLRPRCRSGSRRWPIG